MNQLRRPKYLEYVELKGGVTSIKGPYNSIDKVIEVRGWASTQGYRSWVVRQ